MVKDMVNVELSIFLSLIIMVKDFEQTIVSLLFWWTFLKTAFRNFRKHMENTEIFSQITINQRVAHVGMRPIKLD